MALGEEPARKGNRQKKLLIKNVNKRQQGGRLETGKVSHLAGGKTRPKVGGFHHFTCWRKRSIRKGGRIKTKKVHTKKKKKTKRDRDQLGLLS